MARCDAFLLGAWFVCVAEVKGVGRSICVDRKSMAEMKRASRALPAWGAKLVREMEDCLTLSPNLTEGIRGMLKETASAGQPQPTAAEAVVRV